MDALPLLAGDSISASPKLEGRDTQHTARNSSTSFHSHEEEEKSSTNQTTSLLLCTMAGTGILQLPLTISQGGWAALVLVALCGLIANWTGKLLVSSLYLNPTSHGRLEGYPEIGSAAFGRTGHALVQFFHKATLFGVATIFLILAAKFLTEGLGGQGEGILNHTSLFDDDAYDWTKIWTVASAVLVLLPCLYYRQMGENKLLAFLGAASTVVVVIIVVAFAIILSPLKAENSNHDDDEFVFAAPSHKLLDLKLLPTAFSAIVLSFGGAANFPSIERGMNDPKEFGKALNRTFYALMFLYFVTAIAGYYTFGDLTFSPILCNLPRGDDFSGRLVQVTKLFVAFHVISSYPILMSSLVAEVECKLPFFRKFVPRMLERTFFVALTAVTALYLPFFAELMTLVGAGALTMMVFVMPVVFNFKLRRDSKKEIGSVELLCGAGVIVVGLAGGGIGVYQAVLDLKAALASS
jgi:vesicular inhibitory amino acid transporter